MSSFPLRAVLTVPFFGLAGGILLLVDDLVLLPVEPGFQFSKKK
jgi:hypothetical protein